MCEKLNAGIISVGSAVPETVLTNADLEKIVDTTDEWIRSMTGIVERRIAAKGEATSDYAAKAALVALERAGLEPKDIDLIIVATITGDMIFPSTASIVQSSIGASCPAFDLSAGCSGWVYALSVANGFVSSGIYKRVLVIGADLLTSVTNWSDRSTCVLFGDGAGAAIVGEVGPSTGFLAFELGSDGSGAQSLCAPAGGSREALTHESLDAQRNKLVMEGREVFKFAVKVQGEATERVLSKIGLTTDDIDLMIPHQANMRIIDSAINRLGLPREKIFVNLHKYGNTSAASIPLALDEAVQTGRVKKGDTILLVGFGAGLTWGAGVMKWAY